MYRCLDASIPKYMVRDTSRVRKYPPWFTSDLVRMTRRKNHLHALKARGRVSLSDINEFRSLRCDIKKLTRLNYANYKKTINNNINNDPSTFWSFVRNRSHCGGVPKRMNSNNVNLRDEQSIADAFAQYFQSVFEPNTPVQQFCRCESGFRFPQVSDNDILSSIKTLKPKKTTGPDNIPPYIYKGCASFLVAPLKHIFNLALKQGYFPDKLKEATVTPIFKKGKRENVHDHRPISLLNSLAKYLKELYITTYTHSYLIEFQNINMVSCREGQQLQTYVCSLNMYRRQCQTNSNLMSYILTVQMLMIR